MEINANSLRFSVCLGQYLILSSHLGDGGLGPNNADKKRLCSSMNRRLAMLYNVMDC